MRSRWRFSLLLLLVSSLMACSVLESSEKAAEKVVLQFFDLLHKGKYREAYALVAPNNNGATESLPDAKGIHARAEKEYERNHKIIITILIDELRKTGQKPKVLHVERHARSDSIYYVHTKT